MIKSGLVSISFRNMAALDVISLAKKANLSGIEWGGDIHVPHGDIKQAIEVKKMTLGEGLLIPSYGSYYRAGEPVSAKNPNFIDVLNSGAALQAPVIRVWAGNLSSKNADKDYWNMVVNDSHRIAEMAANEGIKVAYEYHGGTLTDDIKSACNLIAKADHSNLYSYWQPPNGMNEEYTISSLKNILPWLSHIHVFHWINGAKRRPLEEGMSCWRKYFEIISIVSGDRFALLEFTMDNNPMQLIEDAKILDMLLLKNRCTDI